MPEYRAHFDFDIRFANGGGLTGEAFRLDVPSDTVTERELQLLLVEHLGLTLVGSVEISGLRSSKSRTAAAAGSPQPRSPSRAGASSTSATRSAPAS